MPSSAKRSMTSSLPAIALASAVLLPSLAQAQAPASSPPVRALESKPGESGPAWLKAYGRGQWSAAIALLETIPEGSRTAWHWLHLARAKEKSGELVEAFSAYERVQEVAAESPNAPGVKDARGQAKAESASLGGRIPWAEIRLSDSAPLGALVYIDQQWLEPPRLRSPYPVNAGWHTFLLESNGEVLAARRVYFEEGQSRLVPLKGLESEAHGGAGIASSRRLPEPHAPSSRSASSSLAVGASQENAPVPAQHRGLTWRPSDGRALDAKPTDGLLASAYVSLGVGAIGTLVGSGFAIAALSAASSESSEPPTPCFQNYCGTNGNAAGSDHGWHRNATVAGASYAVGLIGLATGGILWLAHREYDEKPSIKVANVALEPQLEGNRATLTGTF